MGRLVYERDKEPRVRRDVNQFTCLNGKKRDACACREHMEECAREGQ